MKVGANQVTFLPWVGYWHRVLSCDIYIDMVDTQFERRDYYNRVKVAGEWMTVPVHAAYKARFNEVTVEVSALKKLAKRVFQTYRRERFCDRLIPVVELLDKWNDPSLLELNLGLRAVVAGILGLNLSNKVRVGLETGGDITENRMMGMLKKTVPQITEYLSGAAGLGYLLSEPVVPTKIQKIVNPYGGNTILQLIATEEDMIGAIMAAGYWVKLGEIRCNSSHTM